MSLPDALADRPFLVTEAEALGLKQRRLRRLARDGVVRRVLRAVYVAAELEDTLELRLRALALVVPPGHVVCDRTAAWIHGVDVLVHGELEVVPPIDTCAVGSGAASQRNGVAGHTRQLLDTDVVEVDGILVTTPLRTALDLGARLTRRDALAAMDALCRLHVIDPDALRRELGRFRRRRGVVQLRELVGLVDPRAESARESWTRLALHDAGLPVPELQHWVVDDDGERRYRLDLAYPYLRIAIEYDGAEFHRSSPEQVERDVERRRWLHDHGWTVVIVRIGDFSDDGVRRWLGEVRAALRPSYTNVRRLERGDRERHWARLAGDAE